MNSRVASPVVARLTSSGPRTVKLQLTPHPEGAMYTYVVGMNVIVFIVAFWTALIYGFVTRDWVGSALWLTLGFAGLTARRLIPPRTGPDDE